MKLIISKTTDKGLTMESEDGFRVRVENSAVYYLGRDSMGQGILDLSPSLLHVYRENASGIHECFSIHDITRVEILGKPAIQGVQEDPLQSPAIIPLDQAREVWSDRYDVKHPVWHLLIA